MANKDEIVIVVRQNRVAYMGTTQIREELHQFINQADERILRLIYGMMKADNEEGMIIC